MGLKVVGLSETVVKLRRTEQRTSKKLLRHMRNSAIKIRDLAREFAPVDEGNLEEAIVVAESKEGFMGRARAVETVGVDPSKLGEGYAKYGERYDVLMHEGVYNLGDASKAKANSNGKKVGAKYLSRAWQELEPQITAKAKAIVADEVRR